MILKLYPENPNPKYISKAVEILQKGGIVIYPTDSVYGIGCNMYNHKAIEKIARMKGITVEKSMFSIICHSLSQISDYTRPINNVTFKLMKKNMPGPFTFILQASNKVPDIFQSHKKTVGIRIPDNPIILEIVRELGNPMLNTSVHDDDDIIEYTTDPELIHEKYQDLVDLVIDGGYGQNTPTTIIDCTGDEPLITRQGIGEVKY